MELLQLHYFRTTARLEHMTKAANELRIAQPALSKTISRLEEDLGVPLFDRVNRQIRLNAFGKAFLHKVEAALTLLEEGKTQVRDMAGVENGTITIATNALSRLSPAIAQFRKLYPAVSFRIQQIAPVATNTIADLLEQGRIDLGFGATAFNRDGIEELAVLQSEVFLAVPHGHKLEHRDKIHLQEAADEPFIEYRAGHPFREVNDWISAKAGIERNIICEVEEPSALGNLVHAGLGVAFVPNCKGDEVHSFALVRLDETDNKRNFCISWHKDRYVSRAALAFRQFLAEYYDEGIKQAI